MTRATPVEHTLLADGTTLTVRPIRPDDAPRLQAFHARLSPETIYWRYLSAHPTLSAAEAERLTSIDYEQRMAFVATVTEQDEEAIIGVARCERLKNGLSNEAEPAIVVEDRYQGRGVGTILLKQLVAHARAHGIRTLVAEINAENDRILRFIRRSGLSTHSRLEGGVWEIRISIA